ncbi:ABC transporter substrate-binding protein [Alteribacter natronophilus]|nr:ABC transporter substrate-binding protein [Alteribacter natronophilus]
MKVTAPFLGAFVLAACGGDQEDTEATEGAGDGEAPEVEEDDGTLVIGTGTDMVTFDIHDHNATNTEAIHVNMFNYLVKRDDDEGFEGDLAKSFENVDDETWHFTLHEGVEFHNGDELTAEDVKFTLERVIEDETLVEHSNYNQIKEVNVLGDYEFELVTDGPDPALLNRVSRIGSGILPADYIEEEGWDHFLSNPVGTGPFEFSEWNRDDSVVLERFDNYFEGEVTEWEEVVFRVIPETSTRVNELLTGGVHIAENVPPAEWDRVNDNDGTSIVTGASNRVMLLMLNQDDEYATSDKRVRQAIDYAIDNAALTDQLLGGHGTPVQTRITPGNTGAHPDLFESYNHDPEKAKELLEEAGYGDGVEITFNSPQGRYMMDTEVAELVRGMLSQVGITANLEFLEWSNFAEMHTNGTNEEMYFLGLGNSMFDAGLGLDDFSSGGSDRTGYENEELDELLSQAAVNMDEDEREEQYQKAQEIVAEDLPSVFLYQADAMAGVSDSVNFEIALDETLYVRNIERN